MSDVITTRLIKIGNSQGIRIPKPLLKQSGICGDVEIEVADGNLIIRAVKQTRQGWNFAFQEMHNNGDDALVDADTTTKWESEEWDW